MKKVIVLLVTPLFMSTQSLEITESCYEDVKVEETVTELKPKDIPVVISEHDLVSALILVESRGNDSAIGDRHLVGEEAVGALQIRPIMVREVNRILRIQKSDKR